MHCNHTGYHGRTGIFEILPIDDTIRADDHARHRLEADPGRRDASAACSTMRMHGARMVLEGTTSIAEIVRQTEEEAVAALDPQAA